VSFIISEVTGDWHKLIVLQYKLCNYALSCTDSWTHTGGWQTSMSQSTTLGFHLVAYIR